MLLRYFGLWFGLMLIGILNGILRGLTYGTVVNELTAHQLSTLTGIILTGIFIYWIHRNRPFHSSRHAVSIGVMWLIMTVLFEFGFGHYVMQYPWSRLLHDYNLPAGRLWLLFLVWITFAPVIFYKFTGSQPTESS